MHIVTFEFDFSWFIKNYTGLFVKSSILLELGGLFTGLGGFEGGLVGPHSDSGSPDGTIVPRQASIMHRERGERVCDILSSIIHQSAGGRMGPPVSFSKHHPVVFFSRGRDEGGGSVGWWSVYKDVTHLPFGLFFIL